jgi:hypothetical protein
MILKLFKKILYIAIISLVATITGCSNRRIDTITANAKLNKHLIQTETFLLTTYSKIADPNQEYFVYIEGDGKAWRTKYQLSNNPTPDNPIGLHLATIDPASNVLYIARPCQFTPLHLDQNCQPQYWSTARYHTNVVNAINQAINLVLPKNIPIHLIGFSGGGSIACLLATKRQNIKSIRTIAGDLDHAFNAKIHQTSHLKDSLNPIDFTSTLKHIPQIHYIAKNDPIVLNDSSKNFITKINNAACVKLNIISNISHNTGWEQIWPIYVGIIPQCSN